MIREHALLLLLCLPVSKKQLNTMQGKVDNPIYSSNAVLGESKNEKAIRDIEQLHTKWHQRNNLVVSSKEKTNVTNVS